MRETRPKISVLIPVFNAEKYLGEAIDSILKQTYSDFELLILNDGSTDKSQRVIDRFAKEDPRIRCFAGENVGIVRARNKLVELASAPLIAWMDADDIAAPGRLMEQLELFLIHPALVCVGTWALCIDAAGLRLYYERPPCRHEEILQNAPKGGLMRFPTTMMRTQVVRDCGGFRGPFPIGEDFDLMLRLSEQGELVNIPKPLLYYRQHLKNTSTVLGEQWIFYRDLILSLAEERALGRSDRLQRGECLRVKELVSGKTPKVSSSRVHMTWARRALDDGFRIAAYKHSLLAFMKCPWDIFTWKTILRVLIGRR